MSPTVDVVAESPLWADFADAEDMAGKAVAAAFAEAEIQVLPEAEIAVILADNAHVRTLNRDWRGKDSPTNVLSFPAAEGHEIATAPLLGDIVVAFETVAAEACAEGKALRDHFAHLVVHGALHIAGFDHLSPDEAETMEQAERAALARLGISDPYMETEPA